jgi:hypothetical protein
MIIDLTGPVPQLLEACDRCQLVERLFRLIGTKASLCAGCFAKQHG